MSLCSKFKLITDLCVRSELLCIDFSGSLELSIFGPGRRVQKGTLVAVLVVVISSLKTPKAFFIRSVAQRNFAYTFVLTLPTDLHRLRFFTYFLINE